MRNFFKIHHHEKLGRLIVTWSTDRASRPRTIKELKAALTAEGIGYEFPDSGSDLELSEILYCDLRDKQLTIIVPTPKQLQQGIADARSVTGHYPFPVEYDLAFDGPKDVDDADDRETILMARIADYCVGSCM